MWLEAFLIFIFILLNGFFAGAEIAIISLRKTRIQAMAEVGGERAKLLLNLRNNPERFIATVQIGVTIMGALASAIGGATTVRVLKPLIETLPFNISPGTAEAVSIAIVVTIISYLTLIFGELLPKSIALMSPEKFALNVAIPLSFFAKLASFFIGILTASTNIFLKPFGKESFTKRAYISEEELRLLIEEGRKDGVFEAEEQELIHSVLEFTDISVKEVMVPIMQVQCYSIETPFDEIVSSIAQGQHSRYPVFSGELNNIKGVLYVRDVFKALAAKDQIHLRKLLKAPLFIPETVKIGNLLRLMQKRRIHMSIVVDEYGAVSGIATIEDLLEEIVGEIIDEYDIEKPIIDLGNGIYIVHASINIRDLKEDYSIAIPDSTQYDTLGGFIITTLQRIPSSGDNLLLDHLKITIIEMMKNRVSKVKIEILTGEQP
jgi:putative hemolysin